MNKKILIGTGIFVLAIVFFFARGSLTGNAVVGSYETTENLAVKIPVFEISDNAVFYDYDGIKYFVVKAEEGSIKTAFNACDICYQSRKGYRQEGGDMVCNNCGNHYAISGLGTKNLRGGGCWPGYLPNKVEGENLVLKKSDLEAGRYRF